MFSRAIFYELRDVAAQLGESSRARLRYSESALELDYAVPHLQQQRQPRLERWLLLPLSLVVLGVTVWQFGLENKPVLVMAALIGISTVLRIIRNPPHTDITFVGQVRITLHADEGMFHFETLEPVAGPPPPIGAALPVAAIRDIRLRIIPPRDEHTPGICLVEIMTEELPLTLFAALPYGAAQQLLVVLRNLTGLPKPESSTAARLRQEAQKFARQFGQRPTSH